MKDILQGHPMRTSYEDVYARALPLAVSLWPLAVGRRTAPSTTQRLASLVSRPRATTRGDCSVSRTRRRSPAGEAVVVPAGPEQIGGRVASLRAKVHAPR